MNQTDFIGLEYRLRHARSKKGVIDSYPELKGKTIKEVMGLIATNTMIMTGKDFEEQREDQARKRYFLLKKIYAKRYNKG